VLSTKRVGEIALSIIENNHPSANIANVICKKIELESQTLWHKVRSVLQQDERKFI